MAPLFNSAGTSGLLFFPVTPFDSECRLDLETFRRHLAAGLAHSPGGVFVGCGTGEFFSLTPDEYERLVAAATEVVAGAVPVVSGAGYTPALCAEYLRRAQRAGADGALLFPPPPPIGGQAGLLAHYQAVAAASPLPLILYHRDAAVLRTDTVAALLKEERIVGVKDGRGNLELIERMRRLTGDRWSYFNGMPTAELSYRAFAGLGVSRYSSAVFAFLPEVATAFQNSVRTGDRDRQDQLLREFYLPFADLRDQREGYPVSLIKAGLRLRGLDVGSVRPPLVDPTPEHTAQLSALIARGLELVGADPEAGLG